MTPANTVVDTWTVEQTVASPTAPHVAPLAYLVADTDGVACSAAALPNKPYAAVPVMTTPAVDPTAMAGVHLLGGGCSAAALPK